MSLAAFFGTSLSVDEAEHGDGRTKMSGVVKRAIASRGDGGGTVGQRSPLPERVDVGGLSNNVESRWSIVFMHLRCKPCKMPSENTSRLGAAAIFTWRR